MLVLPSAGGNGLEVVPFRGSDGFIAYATVSVHTRESAAA